MHPRISELLDYVEKQTESLRLAYESVPPAKRAVRADSNRWSPAEIIHHLVIVERRLAQRLAMLIEQARALPPETETTSTLTSQSTTKVLDRTGRFVTSEASEPRNTDAGRVWSDLMEARQEVVRVIHTGARGYRQDKRCRRIRDEKSQPKRLRRESARPHLVQDLSESVVERLAREPGEVDRHVRTLEGHHAR